MSRARRSGVAAVLALALSGALSVAAAGPALAHPLGNFTINRYSGLDLAPGTVRVSYVVDMAEIPTYQEMASIDVDGDGAETAVEKQEWADRATPQILANLVLLVGDRPVPLWTVRDGMVFRSGQAGLPILRFTATFAGPLSRATGSLSYRDDNYPGRIGWREITARSELGISLVGSRVPTSSVSRLLLAYPKDLLSSPLTVNEATFRFQPGRGTGASPERVSGPTIGGAPIVGGGSFAKLVTWRLTPLVLALSLALAFVFGAVHALGPGHGKTITAAYLVGSGARRRQATVIGVGVSLMHTVSVLALGLTLYVLARSFPPERVYPWLEVTTGLVALALGAGLMIVRVRAVRRGEGGWHGHSHPWDAPAGPTAEMAEGAPGAALIASVRRAEHRRAERAEAVQVLLLERERQGSAVHGGDDHGLRHHHEPIALGPEHRHVHEPAEVASRPKLLALAVAGGILPSPTAFVVLTGALAAHRIGYGLALILAFSVGLAAALMVVGLLAIRARTLVSRRLRSRWARLLPILSAAVIVGFGMFFAANGLVHGA